MARKVLLTTMSVLKSIDRVNYYFCKKGENYFFVNGISSLEQGTKYVLSLDSIDKIVVVGTKETIHKETDKTVYNNLLTDEVWSELEADYKCIRKDLEEKKKIEQYAYAFYKYRIAAYLREHGGVGDTKDQAAVDVVNAEISSIRKNELVSMYEEICQGRNPFLENADEDIWKTINTSVVKDIEKQYVTQLYDVYKENVDEIDAYIESYLACVNTGAGYEGIRQKIEKDTRLSLLEKQYLFVTLRKAVEKCEASFAKAETAKFEQQYNMLHNKRLNMEKAYLQYYAYCNLKEENRLSIMTASSDSERKLELVFVEEQIGTEKPIDNVNGVVNAVLGDGKEDIDLYIDMQGGNRTSSYVRHAMVSILHNQKPSRVHIQMIIGTNFNELKNGASEIVNETERYGILDLLSGMNAFVQYGKADMIQSYCERMRIKKESAVGKLVGCMVDIDDAISVCDMQALPTAIKQLRAQLNSSVIAQNNNKGFVENVFMILKDGIQKDYGRLLETKGENDEVDQLELISWCARKGFVQQALTLVQDKMPEVYFEEEILNYTFVNDSSNNNRNFFIENAGEKYEKRIHNKLFYNLAFSEVNGGALFEVFWRTQTPEVAQNRRNNKTSDFSIFKAKLAISKKELRIYIRNELKNRGIRANKWSCDKGKIEHLKTNMPRISDDTEFARQYCRFRTMENEFELHLRNSEDEQFYRDLLSVEALYDVARERVDSHADYVCRSILGCMGEHEYEIQSRNNKNNTKTMKVNLSIHPKLVGKEKELDELFLLHEALHKERNCSNHASEKGVRLPAKSVKRAIDIYVDKMNEVMRVIKE